MNDLRDLIAAVAELNKLMGAPAKPLFGGKWQVGNYHGEWAAGGVRIARLADESGTPEYQFGMERKTARAACDEVQGLIASRRKLMG